MSATFNAASIVAHPAVRPSDGDNEDKIPLGAIVLVPGKWVMH